jgi:tetratricopeptide (TPR) repeat protein
MNDFENEKKSLHIDEAVKQVLELISKSDFIGAISILKPLTEQFEKGQVLINTETDEYYSFADNIEFFTKLIENAHTGHTSNINALNSNYARMYHLLGYVYGELKNTPLAIKALDVALRWNPVSAGTYLEFAEIYKKLENWDEFLPLALNGLKYAKTSATFARALRGLGYYYCERKEYDLAVALYMHSLQFEENREIVGAEVGYMYEQSGKTLVLPDPDAAVKKLLENNIDVEISNYVFAGYTKFLQALKEAGETQAFNHYSELLKKMIFSPDKIEYLNGI